jgi:hypothetical protein
MTSSLQDLSAQQMINNTQMFMLLQKQQLEALQ